MPLHHYPVAHHSRFEVATDQSQYPTVRDPLRQPSHEHVVIDAIEKLLQINVDHPAAAFLNEPLCRAYRVVRAAPRPEAVAVLREAGVELRLQHLKQELLDEAVQHGGDAQLTHPAPALLDRLPPHWLRLASSCARIASQCSAR